MPTSHISEAEAARDFSLVLARVRAGEQVIVEGEQPVVIRIAAGLEAGSNGHGQSLAMPGAYLPQARTISEVIARMKKRGEETGEALTVDAGYAADLEAVIAGDPRGEDRAAPGRLLSEMIAEAEARGYTGTLDGGFAADLNAVIASHQEPLDVTWD